MVKNLPAIKGDPGLIPESGRSPREGNGNTLKHSCLENSIDRGARWATVHGVAESWTQLNNYYTQNLETPQRTVKDRGAWQAAVHAVAKSQTRLNNSRWLLENSKGITDV